MRPARSPHRKPPTHVSEGAGFDTPRTYGEPGRDIAPARLDDDDAEQDEGFLVLALTLTGIFLAGAVAWIVLASLGVK